VQVPNQFLGIEVKHGHVRFSGRAGGQLTNDRRILSEFPASGISDIEWHFFPSDRNRLGPDVDLLGALKDAGIPFTIWVP
jgi:hypothetical protein